MPIYCFVSGYAHYLQASKAEFGQRWKHLLRFMLTYWVVVALFSLIGLLVGDAAIPGSISDFLLNCLTVKGYNGAWWYVNIYILLVALQPLSCRFAEHCPAWAALLLAFVFYTVGYGIRFWGWLGCDSAVLSWLVLRFGLLGTSYFPYVIGMLFCRGQVISALRRRLRDAGISRGLMYICSAAVFVGMLVMHGIVQTLFVAVITATVTIVLLCVCPMPNRITDLLCYLGEHSANIWLVHMFFYLVLFKDFVFCAKYPIPVLGLLLAVSLAVSYIIKWLSKPLLKLVR